MSQHPYIVDIFGESVRGPLVLAVFACKIERLDRMAVEGDFVFIDYKVVAVNSHCSVIV